MIRVHSLENGTLRTTEGADAVPDAPTGEGRYWVEAVAPDAEESIALVLGLGLHELSLEDALSEGHPPKLEDFGSHLFVIAHTPVGPEEATTRKVSLFIAKTWIVTVERGDHGLLKGLEDRVRRDPRRYLGAPEHLAHAILDHLAEGFEALADVLIDRAEDLEDQACADPQRETLAGILHLRRVTTAHVRVVRDQRDVLLALLRIAEERFGKDTIPYLRDVHDHLNGVFRQIDAVLHALAAVREAYQSSINNQLSDTMRLLTVLTVIFMPLHLLVGFFGMNFEFMPGLHTHAGFWGTVAFMVLLAGGMILWFRRRGWL